MIVNHRSKDIDFEVLYPIIPDYFWNSKEGSSLRSEIDAKLLANFKDYLQEEPNYLSHIDKGLDSNLYGQYQENIKLG